MNWRQNWAGWVMTLIRVKVHGTDIIPEYYHFDTDEEAVTWLVRNTSDCIKEISVSVVAV